MRSSARPAVEPGQRKNLVILPWSFNALLCATSCRTVQLEEMRDVCVRVSMRSSARPAVEPDPEWFGGMVWEGFNALLCATSCRTPSKGGFMRWIEFQCAPLRDQLSNLVETADCSSFRFQCAPLRDQLSNTRHGVGTSPR